MNDDRKNMRGRPRKAAAQRDADRRALAAAAFAILCEDGSAALTARGVARRAGTALGSVYQAFESLEALRLEVNAITMGLLERHLAEALARSEGDPVAARLLALAEAYRGFAITHRPIWTALFEPRTLAAPPAVAVHIADLFGLLEGVLREGAAPRRPGQAAARDLAVLARALWSGVHGIVYLAETGGLGPIGRDEAPAMVESLIGTVVAGLAG